jgi:hypothetical protein
MPAATSTVPPRAASTATRVSGTSRSGRPARVRHAGRSAGRRSTRADGADAASARYSLRIAPRRVASTNDLLVAESMLHNDSPATGWSSRVCGWQARNGTPSAPASAARTVSGSRAGSASINAPAGFQATTQPRPRRTTTASVMTPAARP